MKRTIYNITFLLGLVAIPVLWITIKTFFGIEDRFLPSFKSIVQAIHDIEPNIFIHSFYTILRLWLGVLIGICFGIYCGLLMYKNKNINNFLNPTFQSLRSIPATATIPFFLLWFGFSEIGKFLLIITGISFNLAIATYQILQSVPEKFTIFFNSINSKSNAFIIEFCLPFALEKLLPTIRFSLSTAIGLVVVAEMLGSQVGLGYLIQTARSTFSLNVIFLATIFFGLINFLTDIIISKIWHRIIFWHR